MDRKKYVSVEAKAFYNDFNTSIADVSKAVGMARATVTKLVDERTNMLSTEKIVDYDPQGNLSSMMGKRPEDSPETANGMEASDYITVHEIYRFKYREYEKVKTAIHHTYIENIDIIPSTKQHAMTITYLLANTAGNVNNILKKALGTVKDDYDYILIGNAPATDLLTVNSFFITDEILTPVRCEQFSYEGMIEILTRISFIKEEHDIDTVNFKGAFITQAELNTNIVVVKHFCNTCG